MIHAIVNLNPTTFNVRPVQRTAYTGKDFKRTHLTYLVQFTNDMNGDRKYAYPSAGKGLDAITDFGSETFDYQYSEINFRQVLSKSLQNVYNGEVYLNPSGFWYYVICEVYFFEGIEFDYEGSQFSALQPGYAPINFDNDFDEWSGVGPEPTGGTNGVKGQLGVIVEEGKLQMKSDPTEVTYKSYSEGSTNNYIYNGE